MKTRTIGVLALIAMLAVALGFAAQPTAAAPAAPIVLPDNPDCNDVGYDFGFKIEPVVPGAYDVPGVGTITIATPDGIYFDWASTFGIDAVIVKGGPNANLYMYAPEAYTDFGLHAPINAENGTPYGLSHLEFCYDLEVTVSKTAVTSYTRTWAWDIDKSVAPAVLDMFTGDSGAVDYEVVLTKLGYTDSAWAVSGAIIIANNTPLPATITTVADYVSGIGAAAVTCEAALPYVLAPGGTLNCAYGPLSLPNADQRLNTAEVGTSGIVGGGTGEAAVIFGAPTTLVNDSVSVSDSLGGVFGPYSDDAVITYSHTFTCNGDAGAQQNIATIVETGQWADAWVTVNCYALTVTKTAVETYTRTWEWDIDKSVTPENLDLFLGDSGQVMYTVDVTKLGFTDSGWAVGGAIDVYNPAPIPATLTGVADVLSDYGPAPVTCGVGFPYALAAGATLHCTYGPVALAGPTNQTNTATATLQNTPAGTTDFSDTEDVIFGAPTTLVNDTIQVTDTNGWVFAFGASGSVSYPHTFACGADEGWNDNTATIVETGQSDGASVLVTCWDLTVSKTAVPAYTRTWDWTIDKVGDVVSVTLATGQQHLVNYEVTLTATPTDSAWAVAGVIDVYNLTPLTAVINSVADLVSPDIAPTLDCGVMGFPRVLLAGESMACTYSTPLPDAASRTNTATATLQNHLYLFGGGVSELGTTNFTDTEDVIFGAPTTEIDECVDLTDNPYGFVSQACASGPDVVVFGMGYPLYVGPYAECGDYTFVNTASFVANDTGATGSDSWTVYVHVPCLGCSLTPGYWKTHSEYGPAPYDDMWALLPGGADTPFFFSGQSYYEVLWTAPQGGNVYYILAHAYIAAQLNQLNGADFTDALAAYNQATVLLASTTPAEAALLKGGARNAWINLATILDNYNNGLIGPGHCTE